MQAQTITLIVAGFGIAGTLAGVIIGQSMTSNAQEKQWRRDNVRQECRELLGQLSVNLFAFIDWRKSIVGNTVGPQAAILANQYSDAILDLHRNFGSRILIAEELKKANIPNRWNDALENFDGDLKKLNDEYETLAEEIVQIALRA